MAEIERRVIVIVYNDGRQERYRLTPALEMEFERLYGVGVTQAFVGNESATNVARMAWLAVKRNHGNGHVLKTIEGGWADDIDLFHIDTEKIRPFVAGQEAASSLNSPSSPE